MKTEITRLNFEGGLGFDGSRLPKYDPWTMSTLERQGLDVAFRNWKDARLPDGKESDAFERFSAELILKDFDLSDSEIESGISGGCGDGGVDSFYFLIDRQLVQSDSFVPRSVQAVELNLIQTTTSVGFDEGRIDKFEKFCRYLLDWEDLSTQTNIKSSVRKKMLRFRNLYAQILPSSHSLTVNIYYANKSEHEPSSGVQTRVRELTAYIKSKLNLAEIRFYPWGC